MVLATDLIHMMDDPGGPSHVNFDEPVSTFDARYALAGGAAPVGAQYVVLALDGDLTNERVLTGTANQIVIADGGAGGNVTLSTPQDIHTSASPSFVSVTLTGTIEIPTTTNTVGQIIQNSNRFIHTYGTNNLFLGEGTGNFTLTGPGENVGIGHGALEDLTSGERNMCIGAYSGGNLTEGHNNMAMGYRALGAVTTGVDNLGIGTSSLTTVTTGSWNMAIGSNTLQYNTGDSNVAIGYSALNYNGSGQQNVAIGQAALRFNDTSNSSVAIGAAALNVSTGQHNLGIGNLAGGAVTTGEKNIFIGYQTGYTSETGSNNIVIGYDVDASAADASNELNIGDLIMGYLAAHGSGPAIHFMGGTPQAQQAHIVDADGNLADITSKFNTLLADLEGFGLLAAV